MNVGCVSVDGSQRSLLMNFNFVFSLSSMVRGHYPSGKFDPMHNYHPKEIVVNSLVCRLYLTTFC